MVWMKLRRAGACALVGLGGMWGQQAVQAQLPAAMVGAGAAAKKTYTTNTRFHIPVEIDARTRAALSDVCLFVRINGGQWMQKDVKDPQVTSFTYNVTQDGEYWFHLVTIDKTGKSNPQDLMREPPGLQVVVDTREPELIMEPWVLPETGEACLKCSMRDDNPDLNSVKLIYRGNDGHDRILDAVPGHVGVFRVPQDAYGRSVHLTGKDLCGNASVREYLVQAPAAEVRAPATISPNVKNDAIPANPLPRSEVHALYKGDSPAFKTIPAPAINEPSPSSISHHAASPGTPSAGSPTGAFPEVSGTAPAGCKLLNTPAASLEYQIDHVGQSGVAKVEVYVTPDKGTTWQRLAEDPDRRSPVEFTLPGEGLFGIRLVLTNGNGFGGTPPARGEQPTSYIEVDMTKPSVQMQAIDPTAKDGCLDIRWKARDRNLGAEPVNLFYRTRPDAPWSPMAKNIKNDGVYRWAFPRDNGAQFFVKIEVADQAGNVAFAESPEPIVLDMQVPSATVINVSGVQPRP
jgi:hypothetical protein